MTVYVDGKIAAAGWPAVDDKTRLVCFLRPEDKGPWPEAVPQLAQLERLAEAGGPGTRYESRDGFDYISILAPDVADPDAEPAQLQMVFCGSRLVVRADHPAAAQVLADMADHEDELAPERVLYLLFARLTERDSAGLDDMEEEIARLEEQMTTDKPPDNTAEVISRLRRRLLKLKRYYEALFDLLEDLEENVNGFFSKGQLRSFRIQTNKADRLNRAVVNLRDYVTQVREAYQNQLDIGLNETMKLFTVITTVFLPLTLLTGWYGMNLKMPEYGADWFYPVLVAASVLVVAGCLFFFKRKKWF